MDVDFSICVEWELDDGRGTLAESTTFFAAELLETQTGPPDAAGGGREPICGATHESDPRDLCMKGRCICSRVVRDELAPGVCISTTCARGFFCGSVEADTAGTVGLGVSAGGDGGDDSALTNVGGDRAVDDAGGGCRFAGAGGDGPFEVGGDGPFEGAGGDGTFDLDELALEITGLFTAAGDGNKVEVVRGETMEGGCGAVADEVDLLGVSETGFRPCKCEGCCFVVPADGAALTTTGSTVGGEGFFFAGFVGGVALTISGGGSHRAVAF